MNIGPQLCPSFTSSPAPPVFAFDTPGLTGCARAPGGSLPIPALEGFHALELEVRLFQCACEISGGPADPSGRVNPSVLCPLGY